MTMEFTGAGGRLPLMSDQILPPSLVVQTLPVLHPPNVTSTRLESLGAMAMRSQKRFGRLGAPRSRWTQVGLPAEPLVVEYTSPLLWPTQMMSELPGATAMALIFEPIEALMA